MSLSYARALELLTHAAVHGDAATCAEFKVKPESLARYRRQYPDAKRDALAKLAAACSADELALLAAGGHPTAHHTLVTDFRGEQYDFFHVTDTHVGSKFYRPDWWRACVDEGKRVQDRTGRPLALYHTGDLTEGMSRREGHVYELTHLGFTAQRDLADAELALWEGEAYLIDGNHDRWFLKANDARIVADVCALRPGRHFLGHDYGRHTVGGVHLDLFHGEDGASYAISYRVQKVLEAMTGGEKPHVLLLGHDHKAILLPHERNVACFGGGTLQERTPWQRAKRLAAHPGFWHVSLRLGGGEVRAVTGTFYPFYK